MNLAVMGGAMVLAVMIGGNFSLLLHFISES